MCAMANIPVNALARLLRAGRDDAGDPKYQRVFDAFTEAIRRGYFKPGERIPAESALCAHLPVSLGTLQKALGKLADTGLVVRNRRTGTFVADRRSQASEAWVYRFRDARTGALQMPFVRVLTVAEDRSRGPWRELLDADRFVRVDRLLWIKDDPPAFTSVYFAYEHGQVLLEAPIEELHGSSAHRLMVDAFNLPTLRIEHRISCRKLSREACARLQVASGTLGTVWDVSDYSFDDRAILFQRLEMPPGHRPLEIAESLGAAPQRPTRRRPA